MHALNSSPATEMFEIQPEKFHTDDVTLQRSRLVIIDTTRISIELRHNYVKYYFQVKS